MKQFCPNKASKEFKELASIFGEDKAYFLWMRNKGNELDKAPNGAESKLFNTLLKYFKGDRVKALKAKAKVYSNEFFDWFGDWTGNFNSEQFDEETKKQISLIFKRIPKLSEIGTKELYAKYIQTIFPESQDKSIYWHGSNSDFSLGFKSAKREEGSGAPETKKRNDFYLAKQAWSVLLYVSGVNRKSVDKNGFSIWNKLWWEFKEIMSNGRHENNDWKDLIINEESVRQAIPNKKGIFNRDKGGDNGKWLKERKADYGYENKSDKEFFEEILGVRWGVDTFNTWTQRNAEIFKSLLETESGIYPAVINTINPIREKGQDTYYEEHRGLFTKADADGNDAILGSETDNEFGSDVAVVLRDNSNVHFLGTQEDMDAFSKFVNRQNVSKVVDENGEPLVVYHGSDSYGFEEFDTSKSDDKISLFATDSKFIASTYVNFQPIYVRLVRDRLNQLDFIDAIKNSDWDTAKKIVSDIYDNSVSREGQVYMSGSYGIYEWLASPDGAKLSELERDAELSLASDREERIKKHYSISVKTKPNGKIELTLRDDNDEGGRFVDTSILFKGSPELLLESILKDTKTYTLFLNIKNPLILNKQEGEFGAINNWNGLDFSPAQIEVDDTTIWGEKTGRKKRITRTRDVAKYAKDHGYDGVLFGEIIDHGGYSGDRMLNPVTDEDIVYEHFHEGEDSYTGGNVYKSNIFIAFNPNQMKSAVSNKQDIATGESGFSTTDNNIYHHYKNTIIKSSLEIKTALEDLLRDYFGFRRNIGLGIPKKYGIKPTSRDRNTLRSLEKAFGFPEGTIQFSENSTQVIINLQNILENLQQFRNKLGTSDIRDVFIKTELVRLLASKFKYLHPDVQFLESDKWSGRSENGQVYLNLNASLDVAAEECLHPFVEALAEENPELFAQLLKEAQRDFKELRVQIAKSYRDASLQLRHRELVTQALSRHFANLYASRDGEKSIWRKAWDWILEKLGIHGVKVLPKNLTLRKLSEIILAANSINIDEKYFKLEQFNLNQQQTLQQSVFDIYDNITSDRNQYLANVESNYKDSNPDATSLDIARVLQASRILYDQKHIADILKVHQQAVAALFGLLILDGHYVAPDTMSQHEKQLYEWTINSLDKDTFDSYVQQSVKTYNIINPDQQAVVNVLYQALYNGDLLTIDKELAKNYIRIFWNSDLIQAGLKLFDDGHTTIKLLENKLINAITEIDPQSRITNKSLLDYIRVFWDELLNLAVRIFNNENISNTERLNLINGITSAVAVSQDLEITEGVQPLYDRIDGNYDSSKFISEKDKTLFRAIKSGTEVRLKSLLSRNIQNTSLISDLKLRLEILEGRNEDDIDDVFDSMLEFLETADIELQKTLRYINEELKQKDMSTWDVRRINYIKLDLIGYYEGLIKNILDIFSDPKSSLSKANEIRKLLPNAIDLKAASQQLRNDIVALLEVYVRDVVLPYTEKILVDFVNESDAVKNKPLFIKNMKHWLHQDTMYGDLQSGEIVFGMASRSRSPIVRIIEKMMSDVEFEKGRIVLKRGREIMSLYNKVRSFGSQVSFSNFQKMFIELNGEDGTSGLPTGYFVRDRNYGRFYLEKDQFELNLRNKYFKLGLRWKINPYNNLILLIFPEENYTAENSVYNRYYDELDEWLDKHCERRYTLDYYKNKRRFLSPEALQAQSFILHQIDLLCQKAITEGGFVDTNKLTLSEYSKLKSLLKQKKELASEYIFTTDLNGIVILEEKQGLDLEIAKQILAWNEFISGKINYVENEEKYNNDLNQLKRTYGEDSREVKLFIYNNRQLKINPLFWLFIFSKIDKAEQTDEYNELKRRYRDIINHVKDYNGYVLPDLSKFGIGLNQNQSVWKELLRLEQCMAEIRRTGTKTTDEKFNYLLTPLVSLLGADDELTFYNYLVSKWLPHYNEHPEYRDLFQLLFTYVDKKGRRKVLDAFKYLRPAVDTVGPGIPTVITTYSSQYSEIDENSPYVNKNFDKKLGASLLPKVRKAGTRRIPGAIDYTNENYQKIMKNDGYRQLYDLLIKTMDEANSKIPTRAIERLFLLPQITGRGMSILGRSVCGKELFSAIGYGVCDLIGAKFAEQDKDASTNWDLPRRPDGTIVNNIPIRFVKRLEAPWLVSTDVIGSVMMYYDMAINYSLKSLNLPSLELLEEALNPKHAKAFTDEKTGKLTFLPLSKQYEKVQNLMDFRYYGKEDRNFGDSKYSDNEIVLATTTMSKRFRSAASLSMLALNFTTIEVGYIDAFLSSIADSVGGKYFTKSDLAEGYLETLKHLPSMLANLGNPDTNDWMICAMQYNQLSRSNSEIFDRTDQSRASKLLHMTLMGGYTVGDYLINTMILGATYNHYRLVDLPDGAGKLFMSKSDCIDLYLKYGYTEKEAINKYKSSDITLKKAYFVKDGYLTVRPEYQQYVTKKLENQVAGRLRDRTHLYNGIIPTTEKAKIQQNVWGSYVTLMRNFYVNTYWERAAVGFDYAEQETLPSGVFGRYVSEQAGMVNFETGETGNALGMSFLHGLRKYVSNVYRLFTHGDTTKLSRDLKYALKRISTEILIIAGSIFIALWSLAFARKHDLDDKSSGWVIDLIKPDKQTEYDLNIGPLKINTDNAFDNTLNWIRWKIALLAVRTMTERSTFYWPGTALELVQSVSTAKSYAEDLGYMIDLFMDLLSINGHNSSETVKTGGYNEMSRGTRDIIKILGALGIDNLIRNWHTSGLKSTLNWYSGVTPNNFILPNKSTWEELLGINTNKSSSKSKSSSKAGKK